MMRVVDTDVASFIFKDDTRAALYRPHIADRITVISFMTLAELERWARLAKWGTRRRRQFDAYLRRYGCHHSSAALCRQWAEVVNSARRNGRPIDTADAWIAATALHLAVPLIIATFNWVRLRRPYCVRASAFFLQKPARSKGARN